jgi:hypothetical protein
LSLKRIRDPLVAIRSLVPGNFAMNEPSRWWGKERLPVLLKRVLMVGVSADYITGGNMRHGSRLLHWRDRQAAKEPHNESD